MTMFLIHHLLQLITITIPSWQGNLVLCKKSLKLVTLVPINIFGPKDALNIFTKKLFRFAIN
jgi:hypothetical protein